MWGRRHALTISSPPPFMHSYAGVVSIGLRFRIDAESEDLGTEV